MEKSEKLEKSVKIKRTVYKVKVESDRLETVETFYPLPGYGNKSWTSTVLDLAHSERYALFEAEEGANNWNGTYCHDVDRRFVSKAEAKSIFDTIAQLLEKAEDDTHDIKDVLNLTRERLIPELQATREE